MIKRAVAKRSTFRRVRSFIALGLLLLMCAILTRPEITQAQDTAGKWPIPYDVSAPLSEGLDVYGVLICDPAQNLHILWGKGHESGSEIYYRTDAEGMLSEPNAVLALPDRLALALSATVTHQNSTLHVVWQNNYIRGDVFYGRAPLAQAIDARAWDKPRLMIPDADLATIRADSSDSLHLIYGASDAEGYTNSVYHLRSDDDGLTWSEPQLVYEVRSGAPSYLMLWTAIDARDRIHVGITVRTQTYGVYSELGYMRSLDGGYTWQPYQAIAKQSEATPNVSVIAPFAFGEDEIHLTWHDPRRMHMWSNDGGETWSTPIQIIELGAGFGGANYLAKDSAGVLRAVTSAAGGVYVSTFAGSQWVQAERLESRDMDPHGQQLVACRGNQLSVIFYDTDTDNRTVWYTQKQVDAPYIERKPLPTPETSSALPAVGSGKPSSIEEPSVAKVPSTSVEPTRFPTDLTPSGTSQSAWSPLLISTSSVIVLIAVAFVWQKRRGY